MYKQAIEILQTKLESMKRVVESFSFSLCTLNQKADYLCKIENVEIAISALQSSGAVANEPPTAAATPETHDKYSGVPIYGKKD